MFFFIEPKSSISDHCSVRVVPPIGTLAPCHISHKTRRHPDKSPQLTQIIQSGAISIRRSMPCNPSYVPSNNSTTGHGVHANAGPLLTTFKFSEFRAFVTTLFSIYTLFNFSTFNLFLWLSADSRRPAKKKAGKRG